MGVSSEKRTVRPELDSPCPLFSITVTDGTPEGILHHPASLSDGDTLQSLADLRQAGGTGKKQINLG